ncbi:hypothetical protein DO97_04030 [Neosynechococcus sphagnicola sy1]|uniref:DUF2330 domain-containing protein n=1 Tax=Neosynechococcus sphagnicola sy1 TaxID=1497020 RepID=A0A098TKM4_9CYAN|nr:DUF2330 domain-containing protein [Neosynechococcus sphagnicola]KGF72885.1 hypothetical protein DO97_04030 [Neosynechococcus sphagnicola sy1]
MRPLRVLLTLLIAVVAVCWVAPNAWGFCGFYVAKADTTLYNKASQVAIARDGNRTILTMANDFQGDTKDFAIVVPVPTVLQQEQVRIGDPQILGRLDAFSAPRLVEYFDANPCAQAYRLEGGVPAPASVANESRGSLKDSALGVSIEAKFSVGEYDILILSARESDGLATWLQRNGYKIPRGAGPLLQPYVRQNMKFFVAKVNLAEFQKAGFKFLRPLQIAYESPKFMLPIRLGMINASGDQDIIVYILSPKGQAEVTNYRTVKIPSDAEIPLFVKQDFGNFYKSLFQTAYNDEDRKVAFLEYAWDMSNCDPCSAEPLNPEELRKAGVFWLPSAGNNPTFAPGRPILPMPDKGVFITRLHVRYSRAKFPEDLMFHETANRESFQGRYVLRHPYSGEVNCEAGRQYQRSLPRRFEQQAQTLAKLTGWNIQDIRRKTNLPPQPTNPFLAVSLA